MFHKSTTALQKACLWFVQWVFFSVAIFYNKTEITFRINCVQNTGKSRYEADWRVWNYIWGRFCLWERINSAKQSHSMINRILFCITGFDAKDNNILHTSGKQKKVYNLTSVPCVLHSPPILFFIIWLLQSEMAKGRNCEVTYETFSKVSYTWCSP